MRSRREHVDHDVDSHTNGLRTQKQDSRARILRQVASQASSPLAMAQTDQRVRNVNSAAARGHMGADESALAYDVDADISDRDGRH